MSSRPLTWRDLLLIKIAPTAQATNTTMPPTTPPMIAGVFDLREVEVGDGSIVGMKDPDVVGARERELAVGDANTIESRSEL